MRPAYLLTLPIALLFFVHCGRTGSSFDNGTTGGDGDGGGDMGDGGGGFASGDAGSTDPGTPVSSLTLEQVWFVTRSPASTSDMLIDFRTPSPTVTCGGAVGTSDGFEGTGVFTDPKTADLLFYTDGRSVFNGKDNQLLDNGTGLNGDQSATEPALITPKNDGTGNQFYIFTNDTNDVASSTIWYSVIDLSMGPHGTVTTKNTMLLSGNPGEALDVLPHTNGQDFWVLTYDSAAHVKSFLVTSAGVSASPVVSDTGLSGAVLRGAINHTLDYDHVVLAMNFGGANGLIAHAVIDRSTGIVSGTHTLVTGDLGYHASYSSDGSKLYYVRGSEGWNGVAYQYDLTAGVETMLGGSIMAAAKLAPDGKVYWAGDGKTSLGVVANPNQAGTACGFVENGLSLSGCTAGYGLPNQTASYLAYLPPAPR